MQTTIQNSFRGLHQTMPRISSLGFLIILIDFWDGLNFVSAPNFVKTQIKIVLKMNRFPISIVFRICHNVAFRNVLETYIFLNLHRKCSNVYIENVHIYIHTFNHIFLYVIIYVYICIKFQYITR